MIQSEDLKQLEEKGLSEKQLQEQLDCFRKGFPFLHIQSAASLYNGIQYVSDEQETEAVAAWEEYRKNPKVKDNLDYAFRIFQNMQYKLLR